MLFFHLIYQTNWAKNNYGRIPTSIERDKILIGKTLGKYRIVEHLGGGGMAEVYKAHHSGLDRYVAIKVLHSFLANEKDFLTRFQREAKIVATFRHPNIVQVYDFDFDKETNSYYMVMEFINGPTLKTRLQELSQTGQVMPLEEAIRITSAVASAMDYAHQQGMVHRDIKPANIIFTQDGQVILSDFGIARMINTSTLTATGAMVGTPAYMAPEQGMGKVGDERSDIYSLGAVLYQLVTGTLPFDADTPLGTVLKHINSPLTPPTKLVFDLPPQVETVIMRALAKDPNNRYQTAKEFATDLEKAMTGESVEPISSELAMAPATDTIVSPHTQYQAEQKKQSTSSRAAAPETRPQRRQGTGILMGLVLILLIVVALFATGKLDHLMTTLFSQTATPSPGPTVPPTSTVTPDLTATYDILITQVAAGVGAALATHDALTTYQATINAPTFTPTPTPLPDWTATAIAACVFEVKVTSDQAIQPDVLMPGQQFVKRWTIQNTGTCAWPEDVRPVFVSGDELDVVSEPGIEPLSPGETARIQITLQAPTEYDTYTSIWQLQSGEETGIEIEGELEISCRVGPTPTPRPTATPAPTPTPEFSPTPVKRLEMYMPVLTWCDESKSRGRVNWGFEGGLSDEYHHFFNEVSVEGELPGAYNEFVGFPHVATYFTTSGTFELPAPAYCCPGDYGHFAIPDEYEIVWYKVYFSENNCP
jgi:serine/threonine protein kinase